MATPRIILEGIEPHDFDVAAKAVRYAMNMETSQAIVVIPAGLGALGHHKLLVTRTPKKSIIVRRGT